MTEILTAKRVKEIFMDCLFKKGEPTKGYIEAKGITMKVGFHPGRLDDYKEEIMTLLNELPDKFKASGGGGWTFLNARDDKHGNQWSGHRDIEHLILLGIATGQAQWQMMDMMKVMPGGMPYILVLDK